MRSTSSEKPMHKRLSKLMPTLALLTSLLFVTACGSMSVIKVVDECPGWVRPIGWSVQDTEDTTREIYRHNTEYDRHCAK